MVDNTSSKFAYGHELNETTGKIDEVGQTLSAVLSEKDDVKKYIWTVSVTEAPKGFFSYSFTNAETGKVLRYNNAYTAVEKDPSAKAEDTYNDFVFENSASFTSISGKSMPRLITTWLCINQE